MEPSFGVDDAEFDRPIGDTPSAAGLLQQTDRLAGQHFADEDQPATPFDFAAAAHSADLVSIAIVGAPQAAAVAA